MEKINAVLEDMEISFNVLEDIKQHLERICKHYNVNYSMQHTKGTMIRHYNVHLSGERKDILKVVAYLKRLE